MKATSKKSRNSKISNIRKGWRKKVSRYTPGRIYVNPNPPLNWSSGLPKTMSVVLKGAS